MRRRWPSRSYSATTDVSLDLSELMVKTRVEPRVALSRARHFSSDRGGARERSLDRDRATTKSRRKRSAPVPSVVKVYEVKG